MRTAERRVAPLRVGVGPLTVGVGPLTVGVGPLRVGVAPLRVGVAPLRVGVAPLPRVEVVAVKWTVIHYTYNHWSKLKWTSCCCFLQ